MNKLSNFDYHPTTERKVVKERKSKANPNPATTYPVESKPIGQARDKRSDLGKVLIPMKEEHPERAGAIDTWLDGQHLGQGIPAYHDPRDIERARSRRLTPEDMAKAVTDKGRPPKGGLGVGPEGDEAIGVLDFDPRGDSEQDEGYLVDTMDDFNDVQMTLDVKGRRIVGKLDELRQQGHLSPEDTDLLYNIWQSGRESFRKSVQTVSTMFNKDLEDFKVESLGPTYFKNNFNLVKDKIQESISNRMNSINGIVQFIISRQEQTSQFGEEQKQEYESLLAQVKDYGSYSSGQEWLHDLSLIYGGDLKNIAMNPLDIDYPEDFKYMMDAYKEFLIEKQQNKDQDEIGNPKVKPSAQEKVQGIFSRDFPSVNLPNEGHLQRKIIENVQQFSTLVNQYGFPTAPGQAKMELKTYEKEMSNLKNLSRTLDKLGSLIHEGQMQDIKEIDKMMHGLALIGAEHYSGTNLVTSKDRLNQTFSLDTAQRFRVFLGILYLAKAYTAWRAETGAPSPEVNAEQLLTDIQGGVAIASKIKRLMRLAAIKENKGQHKTSDLLVKIASSLIRK